MALALSFRDLALSRTVALGTAVLGMVIVLSGTAANAKVFYSKEEALEMAFPNAERVEARNFFLTQEQVEQVQTIAKARIDSKLATIHVGHTAEAILGYAFIETHIVRTFPETFLIVLSAEGTLQKLLILAFYEPPEYQPTERWLKQFDQKTLSPSLRLRQELHGIMGSTLTAQAITSGVRKVMALFQVLIQGKR